MLTTKPSRPIATPITNPQAYRPYVALTLNNLGELYSNTSVSRNLPKLTAKPFRLGASWPEPTRRCIAHRAQTLDYIGFLYSKTQRFKDLPMRTAKPSVLRRELARANPQQYLPECRTNIEPVGSSP